MGKSVAPYKVDGELHSQLVTAKLTTRITLHESRRGCLIQEALHTTSTQSPEKLHDYNSLVDRRCDLHTP